MNKKFFALVVVFLMTATASFAAPQEAHSWDELQRLCRVQLAQRDNQGNSTSDGGRLGYLRWDVEWKVTDDWRVYSGSASERKSGEVLPAGSEFYAWFLGGETPQEPTPTTPTTPSSDDKKVEAVTVSSFEDLAAISSTTLVDNGDGGRGATLTRAIKVGPGQRVLCNSEEPLPEGTVVHAGQFIYMWLAPEGYGLTALSTLNELRKVGNLIEEEDGVWYAFSPNELVKFASEDIRAFDSNNFGNEVEDCLLRKDGAYRIFLKKEFKDFTPKNDDDLRVLAHPKTSVRTGPVWTPDGGAIRNFYITLAGDWTVKENTGVLFNSPVARAAGEVIPAGGEMLVNVSPIEDGGDDMSHSGSGSGGEGGGGCDAGMGTGALLVVALFLIRKGR